MKLSSICLASLVLAVSSSGVNGEEIFVTTVDDQGIDQLDKANDSEGSQKDLTGARIGSKGTIGWAWDETNLFGSNSIDTCSYFEETDGSVISICYSVQFENGTVKDGFPVYAAYDCGTTYSGSQLKCSGKDEVATDYIAECTNPVQVASYFPEDDNDDLQAECTLKSADGGAVTNLLFLNTCSKPSASPSSSSDDCLFGSAGVGFLSLEKVVEAPGDASPSEFTLSAGTLSGSGPIVALTPVTAGVVQALSESGGPDDYMLKSIVCVDTDTDQVLDTSSDSVTVAEGQQAKCTFTNTQLAAAEDGEGEGEEGDSGGEGSGENGGSDNDEGGEGGASEEAGSGPQDCQGWTKKCGRVLTVCTPDGQDPIIQLASGVSSAAGCNVGSVDEIIYLKSPDCDNTLTDFTGSTCESQVTGKVFDVSNVVTLNSDCSTGSAVDWSCCNKGEDGGFDLGASAYSNCLGGSGDDGEGGENGGSNGNSGGDGGESEEGEEIEGGGNGGSNGNSNGNGNGGGDEGEGEGGDSGGGSNGNSNGNGNGGSNGNSNGNGNGGGDEGEGEGGDSGGGSNGNIFGNGNGGSNGNSNGNGNGGGDEGEGEGGGSGGGSNGNSNGNGNGGSNGNSNGNGNGGGDEGEGEGGGSGGGNNGNSNGNGNGGSNGNSDGNGNGGGDEGEGEGGGSGGGSNGNSNGNGNGGSNGNSNGNGNGGGDEGEGEGGDSGGGSNGNIFGNGNGGSNGNSNGNGNGDGDEGEGEGEEGDSGGEGSGENGGSDNDEGGEGGASEEAGSGPQDCQGWTKKCGRVLTVCTPDGQDPIIQLASGVSSAAGCNVGSVDEIIYLKSPDCDNTLTDFTGSTCESQVTGKVFDVSNVVTLNSDCSTGSAVDWSCCNKGEEGGFDLGASAYSNCLGGSGDDGEGGGNGGSNGDSNGNGNGGSNGNSNGNGNGGGDEGEGEGGDGEGDGCAGGGDGSGDNSGGSNANGNGNGENSGNGNANGNGGCNGNSNGNGNGGSNGNSNGNGNGNANGIGGGFVTCFSGSSLVEVESINHRRYMQMKDLQIGDRVRVSGAKFERVYSFGHFDPNISAEFIVLNHALELTSQHLIQVQGKGFVPASQVQVGDFVHASADNEVIEIRSVRTKSSKGLFAPFTPSGTIVVSGMIASNYITLQKDRANLHVGGVNTGLAWHDASHAFEIPHYLVCSSSLFEAWCQGESYNDDGLSSWTAPPLKLALWLMRQNGFVTALLLTPLLLALAIMAGSLKLVALANGGMGIMMFTFALAVMLHRKSAKTTKAL